MSKKTTKMFKVVKDESDNRGFHLEKDGEIIKDIQKKSHHDSGDKNDRHNLIAAAHSNSK